MTSTYPHTTIAVLGAGSWGTAMAMAIAQNVPHVLLWGHRSEHLAMIAESGRNERYLPGIEIPSNIQTESCLEKICEQCQDIILMVPSHAFRSTLQQLKPYLNTKHRIAWGTKGLDSQGEFLHTVVAQELSAAVPTAIISGPSFAKEVAQHLPTAVTVTSTNQDFADALVQALSHETFRVYTNQDLIGVQIAGAVKNVLAVASGIADGLGFGANTRAALITRGIAEMMRLGLKLGGQQQTFMGLAGVGDLILTCTDNQSRNRRFGLAIGQGNDVQQAMEAIGQVVEGYQTTAIIQQLAKSKQVDMPITEQVYKVLYDNVSPQQAVMQLLTRPSKAEAY